MFNMCKREKRRRKIDQKPVNGVGFSNTVAVGKVFVSVRFIVTNRVIFSSPHTFSSNVELRLQQSSALSLIESLIFHLRE